MARFEGPVFTFMLNNVDQKQLEKAADFICHLISDHISDVNGTSVATTVSIGIAPINETTHSANEVIERAEKGSHAAQKPVVTSTLFSTLLSKNLKKKKSWWHGHKKLNLHLRIITSNYCSSQS